MAGCTDPRAARSEPRPTATNAPKKETPPRPPYRLPDHLRSAVDVNASVVKVIKRWWVRDTRKLREWAEGKSLDLFGASRVDQTRGRLLAAQLLHDLKRDGGSLELYLRILRQDDKYGIASSAAAAFGSKSGVVKPACLGNQACERAATQNLRVSLVAWRPGTRPPVRRPGGASAGCQAPTRAAPGPGRRAREAREAC